MWKEILYIIEAKTFTREFINWCLSYTLAQPVDIDISIVVILLLQYFGISHFANLKEKVKSLVQEIYTSRAEKKSFGY